MRCRVVGDARIGTVIYIRKIGREAECTCLLNKRVAKPLRGFESRIFRTPKLILTSVGDLSET